MSRGEDFVKAERIDVRERAREFFEPQLIALGLSKEQIEKQTKEELEQSLETVNEAIKNPGSFGTLNLKMTANVGAIITAATSEAHIAVNALPLLLERKKLILERLRILRGKEQIENLENLAQEVSEESVRKDLQHQIEELKADIQKRQEQAKELEQAQHKEELKVNLAITQLRAQAEIDMKKAKVRSEMWQSFLARESIASIVGGFLLILIIVILLIAMFFKLVVPDIINNSFLVILGYFFGQATGKVLTPSKSGEGDQKNDTSHQS